MTQPMTARVYSHCSGSFPVATRLALPTELVGKDRAWLLDGVHGGVAVLCEQNREVSEIQAYGTWNPGGTETQLKPLWNLESPQWQGLKFQSTGNINPALCLPHAIIQNVPGVGVLDVAATFDPAEVVIYEDEFSHKFHVEGFSNGWRIWCEFWETSRSDVLRFWGKVEASDPTNPEPRLYPGTVDVSVQFPGVRTFFEESQGETLKYDDVPIADGAGFPFSGYMTFGPADLLPTPDGMIDGVLVDGDGRWLLDRHVVPGLSARSVEFPGSQWREQITTQSMDESRIGEGRYTHATGDRPAFGWPGAEVIERPQWIRKLARAAAVETFRPIQRLEIDGSPFNGDNHSDQTLYTHNMTSTSRSGSNGYYFGKRGASGSGVPRRWWDLQGGEHDSFHCVQRDFLVTGSPISRDSIERSSELLRHGYDFFRIARHVGRTSIHLLEAIKSPVNGKLRQQAATYVQGSLTRMLDWMENPNTAGSASDRTKLNPYSFTDGYSSYLPGTDEQSTSPFQEGLVLAIAPVVEGLDDEPGFTLDERFVPYFERAIEWLIANAFYIGPFGYWESYYVVGENGATYQAASDRLIILQCAAALAWYLKRHPEHERCRAILQGVWGEDSDCARYLACWITREDLWLP